MKFRVGDLVVIHKPKVSRDLLLGWVSSMDRFDRTVQTVSGADGLVHIAGTSYLFQESWLKPFIDDSELGYDDGSELGYDEGSELGCDDVSVLL